ncbi:MAG: hypothetical protein AB8I08_33865, partial [Sandaracinaceae bacterium]
MRFALILVVACSFAPAARAQTCAPDPTLTRAALALLSESTRPDAARLREAVRAAGSDLPQVVAQVRPDTERPDAFLERLTERWRAPLACGEARSEGRVLTLVSPAAGRLEPDEAAGLRVRLANGFRDARVELRDRAGRVHRAPAQAGDTVIVKPGQYDEKVTVTTSGAEDKLITFRADPSRKARVK